MAADAPAQIKIFFVLLHSSVQQKQQSHICIEGHLPQITIERDLQFVLLLTSEGVLLMTAEEKFELLTPRNREEVIRQIETLIKNQSKNQSSPDSRH